MNSSPVTNWEGVEAYFTFADNPFAVGLIFTLALIVTVGVIGSTIIHENHSFKRLADKD
ncbi:MAG: hypothetical protein ACWA44_13160 [Thiotrichales bacterium]